MTGLNHSLNISSQSLYNAQQGIDTTSHNISNAQTEGYSRQDVRLKQREPFLKQGVLIGDGAYIAGIVRSRDRFLDRQVNSTHSALGRSEGRYNALTELESFYGPEMNADITGEMDNFFDSLQTLSTNPEEMTIRTSLQERGKSLAFAFNQSDRNLKIFRDNINERIKDSIDTLNGTLTSIAQLNLKIRESEYGEARTGNDLRDQRDLLVHKLSESLGINYYEDQFGMTTLRSADGSLLVDRGYSSKFGIRKNNDGMYDVLLLDSEGEVSRNLTGYLKDGSLGALIDVRDNVVKDMLEQNDTLAFTFASKVNEVHKQGFGLGEYSLSNSRNFFEHLESAAHAGQNIKLDAVVAGSTNAISAASTPQAIGDNVVVNRLLQLKNQRVLSNGTATFTEFYANGIGILGAETARSAHTRDADKVLFSDLKSKSENVSGVSLDEEATNMMKWHSAFTASSKMIKTIDDMMETVLSLKR